MRPAEIFEWLVRDQHWARGALPMALVLLILSPLLPAGFGLATFLVFLQLPIYMLHQYEEHANGAFKAFMNERRPPGAPPLTDEKIFCINILGVWGVDLCALYLERYVRGGLGLIAPYLAVINGLLHVGMGIKMRRYNPGLVTGLLLLLPLGGHSIVAIGRATRSSWRQHLLGFGVGVLLHLVTFLVMRGMPRR